MLKILSVSAADVRPDLEACRDKGFQPGGIGLEQEHPVQAEYVVQLDFAAEPDADQESSKSRIAGAAGLPVLTSKPISSLPSPSASAARI